MRPNQRTATIMYQIPNMSDSSKLFPLCKMFEESRSLCENEFPSALFLLRRDVGSTDICSCSRQLATSNQSFWCTRIRITSSFRSPVTFFLFSSKLDCACKFYLNFPVLQFVEVLWLFLELLYANRQKHTELFSRLVFFFNFFKWKLQNQINIE